MSFSEEKIRQITREEIRRILDAGLMYTETSKNAPQTKPDQTALAEQQLLEHKGWKAKKLSEGQYAEGSLNWGWDFSEKFSKEELELAKKSAEVAGYVFGIAVEGKMVTVKKAK